jgi:hypothetical protein
MRQAIVLRSEARPRRRRDLDRAVIANLGEQL